MRWEYGNFTTEILIGKKEERTNPNIAAEQEILEHYIKNFDYDLKIVHNSSDYSTVQYHGSDVLRLKYGETARWVDIFIVPKYKNKYINNPIFAAEKNKNRVFWKSTINNAADLVNYVDIINEDLKFRDEVD